MLYYLYVKTWKSPAGEIKLKRFPFAGEQSHQAWDAADEWISGRLPEAGEHGKSLITVCGEAFGALATAWGRNRITVISDSQLSLLALEENRRLNPDCATGELSIVTADTSPGGKPTGPPAEILVIRLPKSLDLLEIYLRHSMDYCDERTGIWIGGMDKRWNRGVAGITEKFLETAEVFPFERHARWIRYSKLPEAASGPAASGQIWRTERYPLSLAAAPAVFSGESLDAGTSAFLEVFPETEAAAAAVIADIGCGSGILGLTAAAVSPRAEIIFSDESYLAIRAAAANADLNGASSRARFITGNGLSGSREAVADGSADLVLCNPPFHYKNIQTREPAEFMFREALRVLRPGGTVQVVGNSHLGYHKLIRDCFPDSSVILRDSRFTVIRGRAATS